MKLPRLLLTAAAVVLTVFAPAIVGAQTIRERELNQQLRIASGERSGALTPAEAARLERREAILREQLRTDRACQGGRLTAAERIRARRELDALSWRIAAEKRLGK